MPGGCPTKYQQSFNKVARKLCLLGCTDKQLAEFFEINVDTIHEWKKEYPEFSDSLNGGKIIADAKVAFALYRRAIGYQYQELTFEKIDSKGNLEIFPEHLLVTEAYRKKIVIKELPPDVGAATMWLKNRQKDLWRDKSTLELMTGLPENQMDELFAKLIKHSDEQQQQLEYSEGKSS